MKSCRLYSPLLVLLLSCGSKQSSSSDVPTPACQIQADSSSLHTLSLNPSQIPDQLSAPFDQQPLLKMMTLELTDSICWVHQNNFQLEKVTTTESAKIKNFSSLKEASSSPKKVWDQHIFSGVPLEGLTVFSYEESKNEKKLQKTSILLKDSSLPWHLWHEFTHALIGKERFKNQEQKFTLPQQSELLELKKKVELQVQYGHAEDLIKALALYLESTVKYIDFLFLDEILIELTLSDIYSQLPRDRQNPEDLQTSLRMTSSQFYLYQTHWENTKNEMNFAMNSLNSFQNSDLTSIYNIQLKMNKKIKTLSKLIHQKSLRLH